MGWASFARPRRAISRAACGSAPPSSDYQTRLSVTNDIYSILRGEQATAILVTHDISEAVALSDRVVVLSARPAVVKAVHTIEMGGQSPQERRDDPRFREYFNTIWKELDLV